jgi:hypothetical protein
MLITYLYVSKVTCPGCDEESLHGTVIAKYTIYFLLLLRKFVITTVMVLILL